MKEIKLTENVENLLKQTILLNQDFQNILLVYLEGKELNPNNIKIDIKFDISYNENK